MYVELPKMKLPSLLSILTVTSFFTKGFHRRFWRGFNQSEYAKWSQTELYEVGHVFPVVIWSEFRLGKYRDNDYREDAPHFTATFFLESSLSHSRQNPMIQNSFIHILKWSFYLRYLKQFKNWNNIQSNTKEKIRLLLEFQLRWIHSRINDHAQCYKGKILFFATLKRF